MSIDQPTTDDARAGWTRRETFRAAGVAGASAVGVGTLAACGAGSSGGGSQGGVTASGDTIKAADVPVGGGTVVENLRVVVTQPSQGEYKAFSAVCTHQGCLVGGVESGEIICPCHGSAFDISTGAVLQGPATQPLPEKSVTVEGDSLSVS